MIDLQKRIMVIFITWVFTLVVLCVSAVVAFTVLGLLVNLTVWLAENLLQINL